MSIPAAESRPHNGAKPVVRCASSDASYFTDAPIRPRFPWELPVTPEQLFAVFEDPESWPKWVHGIGKVVWTSPPPYGVGTTRTVIFWGGMEVYEEFVVWEAGRRMAFVFYGTTQEVWKRFGEHYEVEPLPDGGCRLVWTVAYEPTGVFAKIHWMIGWMLKLNLSSYMWRLKRYCRRQAGRTAGA